MTEVSPISSASNITPASNNGADDPRTGAAWAGAGLGLWECQCSRAEEEIIFPGGLPRFVQERRVKNASLKIRTMEGLNFEVRPSKAEAEAPSVAASARAPPRPRWVEGCRVLLLQNLPADLKLGISWKNFIQYSGIAGVQRAEILTGESFGLTSSGVQSMDAALLIFADEAVAKKVFLADELEAYGQVMSVTPDPHCLRTLQLVAAAIFARLPRRSTPTSPATPDDAAPRFGGGLSRRAKVVAAGARHALRLASEAVDEAFWRERGAQSLDCNQAALLTVRFPRAPLRDACLAYAPVTVRILDVTELLISMTEAGRVAVVETLAFEEQLFTPLRGELEDVR